MSRVKLEINKLEFQKIVTDLEASQTFANPSKLWQAVEATTWAKSKQPRPLTAATCYQRAKELGIVIKTVAGKRGLEMTQEHKDAMLSGRKTRKPRSEKMKNFASTFEQMRKNVPARFLPLIEQAEKGSLRVALKLLCLDCSNYQPGEIKKCPITKCPLYPHRPYQQTLEEVAEPEEGME